MSYGDWTLEEQQQLLTTEPFFQSLHESTQKSTFNLFLDWMWSKYSSFFKCILCIWTLSACTPARRGHQIPLQSWVTVWFKLRTSERAATALNRWAISPAPVKIFLTKYLTPWRGKGLFWLTDTAPLNGEGMVSGMGRCWPHCTPSGRTTSVSAQQAFPFMKYKNKAHRLLLPSVKVGLPTTVHN